MAMKWRAGPKWGGDMGWEVAKGISDRAGKGFQECQEAV